MTKKNLPEMQLPGEKKKQETRKTPPFKAENPPKTVMQKLFQNVGDWFARRVGAIPIATVLGVQEALSAPHQDLLELVSLPADFVRDSEQERIRVRAEKLQRQLDAIHQSYQARPLKTPFVTDSHFSRRYISQEFKGRHGIYSCSVACVLNILDLFGVVRSGETQRTLINKVGGIQELQRTNGYLSNKHLFTLLESRGLSVDQTDNFLAVLHALESRALAIVIYNNHAQVVLGALKRGNDISLMMHNPMNDRASLISFESLLATISSTDSFENIFIVQK